MTELTNEALRARTAYKTNIEISAEYVEKFDILETITNVGNDEVFTPKKICSEILNALPKEVWSNPNYKWLNPCTKNGIFEREIALKLNDGLKEIIPDEEVRKKHILQNMIYAIGLTKFTSYVARRTLYYCMDANKKYDGEKAKDGHYVNGYAIGNGTWFDNNEGNILTPNKDHTFGKDDRCEFCGIRNTSRYVDPLQKEQYAYEFIHYDDPKTGVNNRFFKGDRKMKFDIIIGNPPYQLSDGGAQASAIPIYQKFIENAQKLHPRYICMIVPSRWMTGGKGLDTFRKHMLRDRHMLSLCDYPNSKEVFPNNDIKGGVCYFVWDSEYNGKCHVKTMTATKPLESERYLDDSGEDIFIRDPRLLKIKNKVFKNLIPTFDEIVSVRKPYGLSAETMNDAKKFNLPEFSSTECPGGYKVFGLDNSYQRTWKYIPKDYPLPKISPCLLKYKVFIAEAYGSGVLGEVPSAPVLSKPGELCTETFLEIGPFDKEKEASNVIQYIKTKFFRCFVSIRKQTQHTTRKIYSFVPKQDFSDSGDINWNLDINEIDKQLYKKYDLDEDDIKFIEENIEAMD